MGENDYFYTVKEEIANSITHGIGFLLAVAGLILLLIKAAHNGTAIHVVCSAIYGSSLILLFAVSTLYHALTPKKAKRIFRIMDHSSIFIVIAGTYTPYTLITIKEGLGWTIFGLAWGFCVVGIVIKIFFTGKAEILSNIFYLLMGWMVVMGFSKVLKNLPTTGLVFLIIGGVLYSVGVIFYALDEKLPYNHAIWHVFVLAAAIFHYFSIYFFVIP